MLIRPGSEILASLEPANGNLGRGGILSEFTVITNTHINAEIEGWSYFKGIRGEKLLNEHLLY